MLRVPASRRNGADPVKLKRQIARFGASSLGMSPLIVYEGADGELVIDNGVTRATRIAQLSPGTLSAWKSLVGCVGPTSRSP